MFSFVCIRVHVVFLLFSIPGVVTAQAQQPAQSFSPPCMREELDQVAFLEGAWEVVSETRPSFDRDEWEESKAAASWMPILNGCALQEQWSGILDGKPLKWVRILAYDHRDQKWEVGMVDWAHGNLITSEGYYEEGRLTFATPHMRRGRLLIDRITVEKLSDSRVNWIVETSLDGGKTWVTFWRMRYVRK